jgi:hypothetical protein
MIRPYSASYECARRLLAAGIPLEYIEDLPRKAGARGNRLHISPLGGSCSSRVLDLKDETVKYLIAVRLSTNVSAGVVITNWAITMPWDHYINWEYDPLDIIPVEDQPSYQRLFNGRLSAVLNNKLHISSGRPVDGLLCGCAPFSSIPKSTPRGSIVHVQLSLTVDSGEVYSQDIEMLVDRRAKRPIEYQKRTGRLFDKACVSVQKSTSDREREKVHSAARRQLRSYVREGRRRGVASVATKVASGTRRSRKVSHARCVRSSVGTNAS